MLCDTLFSNDEPLNNKSNLIVFDTSWVAHASALAKAYNWMSSGGVFSGHIFGFMAKVFSMFRCCGKADIEKTELVFVFDEFPEETYKIFPEYKGGRNREYNPVVDIKELVKLFSCSYASAPGTEADHVIGSLVFNYHKTHNVSVISRDKDLWQLLDLENVTLTSRATEEVTLQEFEQKFGITKPANLALHKAIFGDPSDNIPKLPGRLSHKKILKFVELSDGSPSNFYSLLDAEELGKFLFDILIVNREQVETMFKITQLKRDVKYTLVDNYLKSTNMQPLINYLHKFGIFKFDEKVCTLFHKG